MNLGAKTPEIEKQIDSLCNLIQKEHQKTLDDVKQRREFELKNITLQIKDIQDIYRTLYLRGLNVSQSMALIEAEMPATAERDEILSFINTSTRGIMKGYGKNAKE